MNKILSALFFIVLSGSSFADDTVRDPFMPFVWEKPAVSSATAMQDYDVTPLTEKPLSSYRVVGLIVSPTDSIALIKSRDKREYFANIGDSIGNEGGIIGTINSEGITVDMNGRIIDLTVSNRFDINESE